MIELLFHAARHGEARLAKDGFLVPAGRRFWVFGIWLATVAAVSLVVFRMGFPPVWEVLADPLALLDAGWRIFHGQVPHRDFYSALGPFPLAVFGAVFLVDHHSVAGLPYVLLSVAIFFSALSWIASRDRLSPWWRLLFSIMVLLLVQAPAPLGVGDGPPFGAIHHTTYAMIYNRLGWAALSLQMLVMLLPRRLVVSAQGFMGDAVFGGAMLGCCLFCKVNFALGAAGLAVFWIVVFPERRLARLAGLLAGVLAITLALSVYPGGTLEYFRDQWSLLSVERSESYAGRLLVRIRANEPWIVVMPLLHAWLYLTVGRETAEREWRWERIRWPLGFFVAMALSLFITTFNFERGQLPGLIVAALITLEMTLREERAGVVAPGVLDGGSVKALVAKIAGFTLAGFYVCSDTTALLYSCAWKLRKTGWAAESEAISGPLAAIPIPVFFDEPVERAEVEQAILRRRSGPWSNPGTSNYLTPLQTARWINDGVELLRPRITAKDRLFVADWYNPFNLALGLPPAKGGAVLWDYGFMVDDRHHPDVRQALSEVTLFLVPKRPHLREQPEFMLRTYGQCLGTEFVRDGDSQFWTCWRRVHP